VATLTREQMSLVCNLFNIDTIERPSCTGRHIVDDGETKGKIRHFIDLCHESNDECVRLTEDEFARVKENLEKLNFKSSKNINLCIQLSTKVDLVDNKELYNVYKDGETVYYSKSEMLKYDYTFFEFIKLVVGHLALNERHVKIFEKFLPQHLRGENVTSKLNMRLDVNQSEERNDTIINDSIMQRNQMENVIESKFRSLICFH
jgi:hypothetical protein